MISSFDRTRMELYEKITKLVNGGEMFKAKRDGFEFEVDLPKEFEEAFYRLVDRVNFSLVEDKDNFYGYFLFQMKREIRFDIATPTGVNFKGAKYVIYFNPLIFLQLDMEQMQGTIKHEIHHILALHLLRAKDLKEKYSTLAINLAMDIVANQYIDFVPPYATTLELVNLKYNLSLEHYNTMEYYAENIQNELDLMEESEEGEEDDSRETDDIEEEFNPEKTHDLWEESDEIDDKTLREFTEKFVSLSDKGEIPLHVQSLIKALKSTSGEIPWNIYLKKLMGTLESNKKKTITRRSRRQPERLDLRGELRGHKAEIMVAIDISGSISDEEFKQAIREVLDIVKNYNHEITIIECDTSIKRAYKTKSVKGVMDRAVPGGGTKFSPVFEYVNKHKANLLVYFTDGKGEEKLEVMPKGYKTLWVISGRGDKLSLKQPFGAVKKLKKVEIKEFSVDTYETRVDGWSMNHQEPTL